MRATKATDTKRMVPKTTMDQWITDNDKILNIWLKYKVDPAHHTQVMSLICCIVQWFHKKPTDMCNHYATFVQGSVNLCSSSIKDHTSSDMHCHAMLLLKKHVGTCS